MTPAGTTSKDAAQKARNSEITSDILRETEEDSIVVIPVNEDSKKIRQILSNDTSMKILELLKRESLSASEVAEKLDIPLTTAKYNIDQMVNHDLVRVQRIKYSEKGRQVKIYEAPEKVIVFAPEKMTKFSLISMLQKYAFAFVAAAFGGFGLNYLYQRHWSNMAEANLMRTMPYEETINNSEVMADATEAASGALTGGSFIHDALMSFNDWFFHLMNYHAFWFIAGALFVCIVIWAIEYVSVRKAAESE